MRRKQFLLEIPYLEYNNTMRNFLLDASVSTVKGTDVLASKFGTGA